MSLEQLSQLQSVNAVSAQNSTQQASSIKAVDNASSSKEIDVKNDQNKANQVEVENRAKNEKQQSESQIAKAYDETKVANLNAKIISGRDLLKDELDYLKVKDREVYDNAVDVAKEKKAYEQRLENAKSKEEVRDIEDVTLQKFATEADIVANNPNLGKSEKKAELDKINAKMMGIVNGHNDFVVSDEYADLPGNKSTEYTPKMPQSSFSAASISNANTSTSTSDAAEKAKISFEEVKAKISAALEENYHRQIQELPVTHENHEFLTQESFPVEEVLELDKKG